MTSGNKLKDDNEFRKEVEMLIRNSCAKHNELTKEAAMGMCTLSVMSTISMLCKNYHRQEPRTCRLYT